MKRWMVAILTATMIFSLTACGGDTKKDAGAEKSSGNTQAEVTEEAEDTEEVEEEATEEVEYMESDPLPDTWFGEWICTYSEAFYFEKDETIFVKDFDNAVLYTDYIDGEPYENNRWFCYDEDEQVIHIFNEEPFEKDWIRDSFKIAKQPGEEIVLTRVGSGEEVRFKKTGNNIYDSDKESEAE